MHIWFWLWLLALLPTVMGFSLYTWGLGYLSVSAANITVTIEVLLAAVLAFLAFGKVLGPLQILGGALIITGVVIHTHKQHTAEGVAQDLGLPVAQVVKAMIVQRSDPGRGGEGASSGPR